MTDQEKPKEQLLRELEEARRRVAELEVSEAECRKSQQTVQKEQRLLQQILQVHEQYRQMVAYEIHDGIVGPLTAALMTLESSARLVHDQLPEDVRESCQRALELLRDGMEEARRLISGLGPPVLEQSGIIRAVEQLISETQKPRALEVEFSHDVQFTRLAKPLETTIFRMIQECLTNARRHSQSQKVRIELTQRGDRLHVEVRDWGIGFDPHEVDQSRFGLRGIRERARLFGGRATIESAPGKGTRVRLELPLVESER